VSLVEQRTGAESRTSKAPSARKRKRDRQRRKVQFDCNGNRSLGNKNGTFKTMRRMERVQCKDCKTAGQSETRQIPDEGGQSLRPHAGKAQEIYQRKKPGKSTLTRGPTEPNPTKGEEGRTNEKKTIFVRPASPRGHKTRATHALRLRPGPSNLPDGVQLYKAKKECLGGADNQILGLGCGWGLG